jgi:EmrB/QacA subfamily drug resistance transporter
MGDSRQRNIALLVAGTFFMENLDGTILTTAAPSIGTSLGVPSVAVGVTITAYLLTLAVLIPLSGWITRRLGSRRVFLAAIAVFTLASVLCAISTSLTELVIMRVVQGIGGAMMVPVGRLAVLRVTERADLIRSIALLTWPALVAPVIAPLAGGIITTYATWHWIFLLNVPLGVVAFVAAVRLIPVEHREKPPPLDWIGLVLTCTGLGSLVFLGSLLAERDPGVLASVLVAILGVGLVGLAIRHLLRTRHPLLDLRALHIETFRLSHAGGSLFRLAVSAVPFLLPLLFQDVFGWTPVLSGALVLFVFVGNIAIKPATTPLLRRFGFRTVIVAASGGAAISMVLMAFLATATPLWLVVVLLAFSGVARSAGFTAYNTIAFADVERAGMTDANTLASTLQQVAAGFGVAVGAVALRLGDALSGGPGSGAFAFAFGVLAVLTALATVEALLLSRAAGENIRPVRRGK